MFSTAFGKCGIVWTEDGLTDVMLPRPRSSALRAELRRRGASVEPEGAPDWVRRAVGKLQRHLAGRPQDLSSLPVVLDHVGPFTRRVYEALRRVEPGQTLSYGELARRVGSPGAARAVGQAMAKNRLPLVVPCHRVLGAGGSLGGFSAHGGTETKARLLRLEGAETGGGLFRGAEQLPFDAVRAVRTLRRADPVLRRLIDRVGPLRLKLEPQRTTFAALAEAIVYQQLTMRAGATIFGRLCDQVARGRAISPKAVLTASDGALRAAGLSGAKAAALRDLAAKTSARQVPSLRAMEAMTDAEIIEALTAVRGVGPWTVHMLLIFRLGRPDVLPAADYALRKGFARAFQRAELPSPRHLEDHGDRWRPYRSVASWYLWRAVEQSD
jgi:methylated-DNA-[protein]-cysteine S-methyltransferase